MIIHTYHRRSSLHFTSLLTTPHFSLPSTYRRFMITLQIHFTLLLHFTSLHYTSLHFTSLHFTSLHFTTLHFTTLHFTSLHYTSLHYTTLHFTSLTITLLTLFLKIYDLQGKFASSSAGSWFQCWMFVFYKGIFPDTCSLFPDTNFPIMIIPAQVA